MRRRVLPALGKVAIRRLRYEQIEAFYDRLFYPETGRRLAPKTVYGIHLIVRGALTDAHRRGLVSRNVALIARTPSREL